MVVIKTLSFAALVVGAFAAPIATVDTSKPFKIGVTFDKTKETLYLTNSATASPNVADGIECTITTTTDGGISNGKIACGPEKKAFTYSELHTVNALAPVPSDSKNKDWSIKPDNAIYWGAYPTGAASVTFSRAKGSSSKTLFAEVCTTFNHHALFPEQALPGIGDFWERGTAKAYFV